jgi:glutathione S-transferase
MLLVIGNKRYSSWSLRPWVLMRHFGLPFEEKLVPLDQPTTSQDILKFSPSAKVPALIDDSLVIWDSLAICEYLNEKFPEKKMWPTDVAWRARARSVASEMHSGFALMREHLSHDIQKKLKNFDWSVAKDDVNRVMQIWRACLKLSGGPFLFKNFSIADAMYAPVVNRFITYGVETDAVCSAYIKTMRELPAHKQWIDEAMNEKLRVPRYE